MPFQSNRELPPRIKALSIGDQTRWRQTFNSVFQETGSESRAFAVANSVIKKIDVNDKESVISNDVLAALQKLEIPTGGWVYPKGRNMEYKFLEKVEKQRFTLGIVYEPNVIDSQDDFTDSKEIEKTAWAFMEKLQGISQLGKFQDELLENIVKAIDQDEPLKIDITEIYDDIKKGGLNDMHVNKATDDGLGTIVESFIAPVDFDIGEEKVTKGTWLLGVVWSEEHFKKIENKERTGFSLEGKGKRIEVDGKED